MESVYILGDTLITKSSQPNTKISSFGQLHDKVRCEYVEESLLKIVPIAPDIVVAFAGDVDLATALIEFLKENLYKTETFERLFDSVNVSLGPFSKDRQVELLLAHSSVNRKTILIKWDTVHGFDDTKSDYYQIGSLTSYHAALTPMALSIFANGNLPQDRILAMLTSVVQSYGVHDNLIDQNIGGIIFGLFVHNGNITWQEDTNFILYDPDIKIVNFISAFVRDNVLIVNSSFTNSTLALAHSSSIISTQAWLNTWISFIRDHLNSDKYKYWVFLGKAGRVITVLRRDVFDSENKYFSLKYLGDGKFDLGLSPEMMALLKQPLRDRGDGSLPFRFNFRNA